MSQNFRPPLETAIVCIIAQRCAQRKAHASFSQNIRVRGAGQGERHGERLLAGLERPHQLQRLHRRRPRRAPRQHARFLLLQRRLRRHHAGHVRQAQAKHLHAPAEGRVNHGHQKRKLPAREASFFGAPGVVLPFLICYDSFIRKSTEKTRKGGFMKQAIIIGGGPAGRRG